MIREVHTSDAASIARIYNHYVRDSVITFEETEVSDEEMANRIEALVNYPWIVYEKNNTVIGYAYGAPWKSRSAYRYTVESSIYLSPEHTTQGIGKQLYESLLNALYQKGYIKVLAGIALPNPQSVHFHEALGFRKVGQLEHVGLKFDRWIDVGYWEKELA